MIFQLFEKRTTTNSVINNLKVFFMLLIFCVNTVTAQDLITESQAAVPPNQNLVPNQIFRDINLVQNTFIESTPLKLSSNGTNILNSYQSLLKSGVVLEEMNDGFQNIINTNRQNIALNIPVGNDKYIKLKLEKTNIYTDDFVFRYGASSETGSNDETIFYRGIVDRKPLSSAAITVTANSIRGVISDEYGNYTISSLTEHPNKYLLYSEKALNNNIPFNSCGTGETQGNAFKELDLEDGIKRTQKNVGDCIEIYIECDYSMYEAHNYSVNSVKKYVSALFNEVSLLYYNERINIFLSDLYVWTSPDPYRNLTTTFTVLDAFGGYRKDNYNGRLAHLLTRRNLGEGGRAWLDVLCDSYYTYEADYDEDGTKETYNAGPYGVSTVISNTVTPFNTYSWDVFILAHELGHNFGSPHTHACKWGPNGDEALDNCWFTEGSCGYGPEPVNGGTIMSYCNSGYAYYNYGINFNNGFGTQPGNLMRNSVNVADCLSECPCGVRSNKNATIFENYTWLSTHVNQNDCNNEIVTSYNKGSANFIYVEKNDGGILYNQNGLKYCTNRANLDCISYYDLNQIDETWACSATNKDCVNGGCTDTDACNYNPQAEFNDGSCDFGSTQCPNPCSVFTGCTNPAAINYQSNATCDDGSCEYAEGCDADIFVTYPWLNGIVNQSNCSNEEITVYKKGNYNYLYIEYENEGVLYIGSGTQYCSDSKDGFCTGAYSLTEVIKLWSCTDCLNTDCDPINCSTDPCTNGGVYAWSNSACRCVLTEETVIGCNDPAATNYNSNANCDNNNLCSYNNAGDCNDTNLFTTYNWLNSLVDRNNCNTIKIDRYDTKSFSFLYVQSPNSSYLLYENGDIACSDNGDGYCPQIYNLSDIGACWSCNGVGQTGCTNPNACNYNANATISDNTCDFGNQTCNNPCAPLLGCVDVTACNFDSNACVDNGTCEYLSCCDKYQGQVYYNACNGEQYYLLRLTDGTILDPYNGTGVNFDYPDGAIINFNYQNYDISNFCELAEKAVLIECFEVIGNTTNVIFDEFPFLRNIIDPANCNNGAYVEVFQFSTYAYLYVFDGQSGKLYREEGTRYCSDRQNTNCKQLYNLSDFTSRWDCSQGFAKLNKTSSLLNVTVFPNPNNGTFTFYIDEETNVENALIKIYNINGQILQTIENVAISNNIQLGDYGNGLYWIELLTPNNSVIKKVIVQ